MKIKFKAPDPRAGTVALMDSSRGQYFIDTGSAVQVPDGEGAVAPTSPVAEVEKPKRAPRTPRAATTDKKAAEPEAQQLPDTQASPLAQEGPEQATEAEQTPAAEGSQDEPVQQPSQAA